VIVYPARVRGTNRKEVDEHVRLHPNEWSSLEVRLYDCSPTGFRAECEARVRPGDLVTLELPGLGRCQAHVSWCRDRIFGARFVEPIDLDRCGLKPASPEVVLARLLVQRARAHVANLREEEEELRKLILESLPMKRGEAAG
jgi:hypothetical protein